LFLVLKVSAQQDPQFSQNLFINAPINPGASGIKGMHCFDLLVRQQWIGFDRAPRTGLLSYNGPLRAMSNIGLGGVLVYDQAGLGQNLFFKLNGSYHFNIGSNGAKLGIGVDVGMVQKSFDQNPKAINQADPIIANILGSSDMGYDVGFGVFYYKPQSLYFGISGQKLLPQQFTLGQAQPNLRQHCYITAGYNHNSGNDFVLRPNMLVKTDLTSTQVDVNLTAEFKSKIWLGASYRVQDAVVANIGFKKGPNTKFGIAYDYTTQALKNKGTSRTYDENGSLVATNPNNKSLGSVELYIGHCIIPAEPRPYEIYVDPLFL